MGGTAEARTGRAPSLWALVRYFLYLGTCGFGGPIALAGYMQKDLVDARGWITPEDYKEGLVLAQLAPGPLAAQLAIYHGYVQGGVWGATAVGLTFILPSFLMVWGLSALYVAYGGLWWMQALFYGIGAGVIAIIVRSAYRLTKLTMGKAALLWAVFAVMAITTAWTEQEILTLFILCGLAVMVIEAPPQRLAALVGKRAATLAFAPWPAFLLQGLGAPATGGTLAQVLWFFTKAGAFVFGSGLAIVPFLYGGVVQEYGWLNDRQFLDAVAVAMITPGPVVITVAFIGYLVGGLAGAILAAVGVFMPVYLFVVLPAPWFRRNAKQPQLNAFVRGVTAAATGAIAGAAFVLGRRAIFDIPTAAIGLATFGVITRFKLPEPFVILATGAVGLVLFR